MLCGKAKFVVMDLILVLNPVRYRSHLQVHHILCNKAANLEVPIQPPINTLHYTLTWQILTEEFIKYMLFERMHNFYVLLPRKS
jgi:hypothetical protein